MDYEKICNEILNCDKKIRYAAIYDYGELYDKMRQELLAICQERKLKLPCLRLFIDGPLGKKPFQKLENQYLH